VPVSASANSNALNGTVMLTNGPLITHPPPLPCGRVTPGPSEMLELFAMTAPSPDKDYADPSNRGLVARSLT
jgi:hypothetical protein